MRSIQLVHARRSLMVPLGSVALALAALVCLGQISPPGLFAPRWAGGSVSVVVAGMPASGRAAEAGVMLMGGRMERRLDVIDGLQAQIPRSSLEGLRALPAIRSVAVNGAVRLTSATYDPVAETGSMYNTTVTVGAREMWARGYTGQGVDVALIDSGVTPVAGLSGTDKVLLGPDLSSHFGAAGDGYGHGTHLAGIIAGRDTDLLPRDYVASTTKYLGMAPDARIVSIKVAGADGATDVSQVIAAIDWIYLHHSTDGLNIRVLNLSFGTDSSQSYVLDPLAYAAESLWRRAGIAVIVSAGNKGAASAGLSDPAYDPYLIAVGASEASGSGPLSARSVASFSSYGDASRSPDLVAPGVHIQSLRVPGSQIAAGHPSAAATGSRFLRGSGTSQAAAVVSGAAALLLQENPWLGPDQLKRLLASTATPLGAGAANFRQGTGEIDLKQALASSQSALRENPTAWAAGRAMPSAVSSWNGNTWDGNTWDGNTWGGNTWGGNTWGGNTWGGNTWGGI